MISVALVSRESANIHGGPPFRAAQRSSHPSVFSVATRRAALSLQNESLMQWIASRGCHEHDISKQNHLALPMRDKHETAHFYGEMLGLRVVDFSPSELCVDLFDQHIAFHWVPDFFEVKAPLMKITTDEKGEVAVSSLHFGAVIRKADFDAMVERIRQHPIEVIMGPATYRWPDGTEEYMIQFYDCNHFNVELKANATDEMCSLDDLEKWSHKLI